MDLSTVLKKMEIDIEALNNRRVQRSDKYLMIERFDAYTRWALETGNTNNQQFHNLQQQYLTALRVLD